MIYNILLMAGGSQSQQNPWQTFIFLGLIIVIFYFFMIRPQIKKQKELANYRSSLKKGDKIVTTGGIYGKITEIKDQHIMIEIADNVVIKIDFNAILKDPSDVGQTK